MTIEQVIRNYFEEQGWAFDVHETKPAFRILFQGQNGRYPSLVEADEARHFCVIYCVYPQTTPEPARTAMMVELTRINYGLPVGNFEFDANDGEIRFKTSLDLGEQPLTANLFARLFANCVGTLDYYVPQIQAKLS